MSRTTVDAARRQLVFAGASPSTPRGRRLLHGHILEHEDQGMMAVVDVGG